MGALTLLFAIDIIILVTLMTSKQPIYLVSACLVGLCTRYDGELKESKPCLARIQNGVWIPICPEQLGGLPTPREAADIHGGNGHDVLQGRARVLTKSGVDVSSEFVKGARQILKIASEQNIERVFLKARSPSCGVTNPTGVTAALLREHGFQVTEF